MTERTADEYKVGIEHYVTDAAARVRTLTGYREDALRMGQSDIAKQHSGEIRELRTALRVLQREFPDIVTDDKIPPEPRSAQLVWLHMNLQRAAMATSNSKARTRGGIA